METTQRNIRTLSIRFSRHRTGLLLCAISLLELVGCVSRKSQPAEIVPTKPLPTTVKKDTALISPFAADEFIRSVEVSGLGEGEVVQLRKQSRTMVVVGYDLGVPKRVWMERNVHAPSMWHLAIAVYDRDRSPGTPPRQFVPLMRKPDARADGLPVGGPVEARTSSGEVISLTPTIPSSMGRLSQIWSASYSVPNHIGNYELQIHLFPCADIPKETGQPFTWGPPVVIYSKGFIVE